MILIFVCCLFDLLRMFKDAVHRSKTNFLHTHTHTHTPTHPHTHTHTNTRIKHPSYTNHEHTKPLKIHRTPITQASHMQHTPLSHASHTHHTIHTTQSSKTVLNSSHTHHNPITFSSHKNRARSPRIITHPNKSNTRTVEKSEIRFTYVDAIFKYCIRSKLRKATS